MFEEPIHVTDASYEQAVLKAELPVIVDFWAPWCGPCKMMSPVVDQIGEKLEGQVKVVKCNVDDSGAVAEKYNIMSIPNFFIFKDGKAVTNKLGATSPADFEQWIKENI